MSDEQNRSGGETLQPGSEIAGYRIERFIAHGGMGFVYEAVQLSLDRRVALKFISSALGADPRFRARFRHEARLAAAIDDPHILPVYEAGEMPDGRLFLALRFVDGPDLGSLLRERGPLDPEQAIEVLTQVGEALDAAHERGLVHRDVKPANVMLDVRESRWHAYLTDFGLAKADEQASEHTATGELLGTIDYMAPEQIQGEAVDGRADVYAFGCMTYRCLTGSAPYRRDSRAATMMAHLNAPVPLPSDAVPGLPRPLDMVVQRAMEKDPAKRARSAGALMRWAAEQLRSGVGVPPPVGDETPTEGTGIAHKQATPVRRRTPRPPAPAAALAYPPPGATPQKSGPSKTLVALIAVLVAAGAAGATFALRAHGHDQHGTPSASHRPRQTKQTRHTTSATTTTVTTTSTIAASGITDTTAPAREQGEPGATTSLESYEGAGYTAEIPAGWHTIENDTAKPGYNESKWQKPGEHAAYLLIDSGTRNIASLSPAEEAAPVHQDLERLEGYEELAYTTGELAGMPAQEWVFKIPGSERVDYFFQECEHGYAVLGSAPPSEFTALEATFRAVAESVDAACG